MHAHGLNAGRMKGMTKRIERIKDALANKILPDNSRDMENELKALLKKGK